MNKRTTVLLVLAAVVALVFGSFGTATAGGLTKGKVKKIAAAVVDKQAPSLAVSQAANAANAANLGGKPATAYLDNATVYTVPVTAGSTTRTITIPLAPGTYQVSYSAYLAGGGSGSAFCFVRTPATGTATFITADDTVHGSSFPSMSGTGVVTVAAGQTVALYCAAGAAWSTGPEEPIQIVVVPLDSVTGGILTATAGTGARGH